jgi:hypothetical protein
MRTPVIFVHAIAQEQDVKPLGESGLTAPEAGTSDFDVFSDDEHHS